jgi:hypothetical protein
MRGVGRLAFLAAVGTAVGCVAVTTSNPPGPPPAKDAPYAGRIVLSSPGLHGDVEAFGRPWSKRMSILGLSTRIVYDESRAVFDVYGAPPSMLAGVAGVLTDPGGWHLGSSDSLETGTVTEWMPPTTGCDCGAQMRMTIAAEVGCHWRTGGGPIPITRAGSAPQQVASMQVRWHYKFAIGGNVEGTIVGESDEPRNLKCPDEEWPIILIRLLPGTPPPQATAIALALGGAALPEIPRVESITPASGAGRP